jgi:large subunit ribosomal protein L32
MANPKNRFSKARTARRRANWKLEKPNVLECPKCHAPKMPHRVCPECGFYKNREAVATK